MPNLLSTTELEMIMSKVKETVDPLIKKNKELEERIDDLEDRLREIED